MIRKTVCKKGCIYYNWTLKKCDYSDEKCAIEDLPIYGISNIKDSLSDDRNLTFLNKNVSQTENRQIPIKEAAGAN